MASIPNAFRIAVAALCLAALPACSRQPGSNEAAAANAPIVNLPAVTPSIPLPEPPLDRAQLLTAAIQAASDFAGGIDDSAAQRELADRKFELRIRFGCGAPGASGAFSWSFDPKSRTLKVKATPDLSLDDAPVAAVAGKRFDSVEGFWLVRPWMLEARCPNAAAPAATSPIAAAAPAQQLETIGIGQFFTAAEPRTLQRSGRSYQVTKRLDEGDQPSGGFDLVLEGRLVALADSRVIACTGGNAATPPQCVISASMDTVRIERADTQDVLGEWGAG